MLEPSDNSFENDFQTFADLSSLDNIHINKQLLYFDRLSAADCAALLKEYYRPDSANYHIIENAVKADTKNTNPLLFSFYALIVDDIYKLDQEKIEHTLALLNAKLEKNPHYAPAFSNLLAIDNVLNRSNTTEIKLPDNCYVNLAKANLSHAKLDHRNLAYFNFAKANLESANLSGSQLNGANLKDAILDGANLRDANLQQVALNCSLKKADLTGADLTHGYLQKFQLDLTGAKICHAKMDEQTLFVARIPQGTQAEFDRYIMQKKNMLSQVEYFDINDFADLAKMKKILTDMHESLKNNAQFTFIQQCICYDFIRKTAQIKIGCQDKAANPELANQLYQLAYAHPLFEHDMLLVRTTNIVSRSVYSLFFGNEEKTPEIVESTCQQEMRQVFGVR